jgi:polar amino acid transport system substrate-binding protein
MVILTKAKQYFLTKKGLKTYLYGGLVILAFLSLLLLVRGCAVKHMGHKGPFLIGRESELQIELLGREKSLVAFTNDLMAEIAHDNNLHFQWVETNPNYLISGLDNGRYDFILTSIRPNVVNEEKYDFSLPLFDLGPVLIVRAASQFTSLKELKSLPIGILYGMSTNFNAVREPGMNVYDLSFIYYNNINKALEDLQNDQIDGVIMTSIPAYAITEGLFAGKLKVVTPPLNDEGLRLVALKSSSLSDVIDTVNQSVNLMRQDGTYDKLIRKWHLIDPQTQYWHPH